MAWTIPQPELYLTIVLARLGSCVSWGVLYSWLLTAVCVSHSQTNDLANHIPAYYLPLADLIMVLGDNGQVAKQGTYAQLRDDVDGFIQMNDAQLTQADEAEEGDKPTDVLAEPPAPTSRHF